MSDGEWQRLVPRVTTNENELKQMTMSDSEWQKVIQRVKTANLLQKWMIAILSITKIDTLFKAWMADTRMAKYTTLNIFQNSSWS